MESDDLMDTSFFMLIALMKTKSETLVKALRHMNEEIESSIIAEAANRIEELEAKVSELTVKLCRDMFRLRGS